MLTVQLEPDESDRERCGSDEEEVLKLRVVEVRRRQACGFEQARCAGPGRPGCDGDFRCARHRRTQAALADRDFRVAALVSAFVSQTAAPLQHSSVRKFTKPLITA